ncbi:MAG TPA: FAD-dependent oxidoreductase [Streptomyces sp.]|nr:FAD-dependent oxidoreductase [Streptomyces sp.]
MSTTVIVGGSIGGVRTAQALRSEGFDGELVLVDEQAELPYDKPPLSKGMLTGTSTADSIRLLTAEQAQELRIQLVLGRRAARLDVAGKAVELEDGERLTYDNLVIATGAAARPSPWGARPGIHVVRSLADAEALREGLLRSGHVVVVGGGFIGAEVAASARTLGIEVTMVDPLPTMMSRSMSTEVGAVFADFHRRRGVECRFGVGVDTITGERGDFVVGLTDGTELPAASVVVGIGAVPNDDWLKSSGLFIENGVVCDEFCRAVDAPQVYAVGDIARWLDPARGELVRLEHWTNAVDQAVCVAHNITHPDELRSYSPVEYVWSDQHDWKLQLVGRPHATDDTVLVGDPAEDRFAVLQRGVGGSFAGAVVVNWPKALVTCRKALADGADLEAVQAALTAARPIARTP